MDSRDKEFIESLQELIRIKSVKYDGADSYEPAPGRPFGKGIADALEYTLSLCGSLGMRVKNCDGYAGYAEIGEGDEMLGILMHLDVVPEGLGWDYPPYGGEIHDRKLYGRGAVDDKGPAMAVIYAVKELMDEGYQFGKRVRLIFGCDEENDWECMDHYVASEECPDFGFTPDADFPLIYGEMGILQADLVLRLNGGNRLFMEGGEAVNAVPDYCKVWISSEDEAAGAGEDAGSEIVHEFGIAAHASTPQEGDNAITKAMKKLAETPEGETAASPEVLDFIRFYNEKIGSHLHGEGLGCDFADEQSGRLTFNAGRLRADADALRLGIDVRCPVTIPGEEVIELIRESAGEYGLEMENIDFMKPVYSSLDSEFIKTLLEVYQEKTGDQSEPLTMGGGTYARAMDNIVAFGPLFPGREATEHMKNEYILTDDLLAIRAIYKEAILRLAK